MTLTSESLAQAAERMLGAAGGGLSGLARLSGGANMESWSFDWGGAGYVLRRAPSAARMVGRPYSHAVEAALVRAAHAAGVRAPEVVGELIEADGLGTGYVMRRVEAEVAPARILADHPANLIDDIARELARIHSLRPGTSPLLDRVPTMDTAAALAELDARFQTYGGDRPIIALAIRWCEDHLPAPCDPRLVHGDFRMGNLMVDGAGLAAVLDWEIAHWGDPHDDLAYGCMTVWRFGRIDRPAYGIADLERFFAAYEAQSGRAVDRARFRFWLVYRTLWWALGCLGMGELWRTGADRNLERAVIGRRTSENELDLLLLLEEDAPQAERRPIRLEPSPPARRQGEPSAVEMLEAVREWIDADVKPRAEGRDRFMAAVAMNALGMLVREASHPVQVYDAGLSADLRSGRVTLATPGVLARLRAAALAKLENDVPKYAALAQARAAWLEP
ncbi:MAG: phosphotransferase [Gammaproteobacteria bacterium]